MENGHQSNNDDTLSLEGSQTGNQSDLSSLKHSANLKVSQSRSSWTAAMMW